MKPRNRHYLAACLRALAGEMRNAAPDLCPDLVASLAEHVAADGYVPEDPGELPSCWMNACGPDSSCRTCAGSRSAHAEAVAALAAWTWRT